MEHLKITDKEAEQIIAGLEETYKSKREEYKSDLNKYIDWLIETLLSKETTIIKLIQGDEATRKFHRTIRKQLIKKYHRLEKQKTKTAPIRYTEKHFRRIDALRRTLKTQAAFEIVAKEEGTSPEGLKQQYYERWYHKKVRRS